MLYLDHNATTFMLPEVKKLIISLMDGGYNASSVHSNGRSARRLVEHARGQVAKAVGVDINSRQYQLIFTSSGTESNNLIMSNYYDGEIFISAIEHLSIFEHLKYTSNIKIIKVDHNGLIDLDDLEKLLSLSTNSKKLVSVMLANNESGVIQDIAKIAEIAHKYQAIVHSDCVQAFGKIPVNIKELATDFITLSAHKIGGGQGSSALIGEAKYILKPLIIGGGQEKNMRSGTENVAAIAAFGLAAEIAASCLHIRYQKMQGLQRLLEQNLSQYKDLKIVAQNVERLPNTSLIIVPGTEAQVKLIAFDLRGVLVSSGSACSSGKVGASYVLAATGVSDKDARSSIRVSFGYENTEEEVLTFIKAFAEIYF